MNTPLQQAAQAVLDKFEQSHPLKELAILELRKALDAELQQTVKTVLWITDLDDPIICKTEFETATFCEDGQHPIPLYLHPPQQVAVPVGYVLVPIEVQDLYNFMTTAFVPMTPQQKEIWVSMDLARKAMAAAQGEKP